MHLRKPKLSPVSVEGSHVKSKVIINKTLNFVFFFGLVVRVVPAWQCVRRTRDGEVRRGVVR
jgi:hypothetical protein